MPYAICYLDANSLRRRIKAGISRFSGERMGGVFDVGTPGAAGEASIGCALLEAINDGTAPVVVQMRFVVASSRP